MTIARKFFRWILTLLEKQAIEPASPLSIDLIGKHAEELADAIEAAYQQAWETNRLRDCERIAEIIDRLARRMNSLGDDQTKC